MRNSVGVGTTRAVEGLQAGAAVAGEQGADSRPLEHPADHRPGVGVRADDQDLCRAIHRPYLYTEFNQGLLNVFETGTSVEKSHPPRR